MCLHGGNDVREIFEGAGEIFLDTQIDGMTARSDDDVPILFAEDSFVFVFYDGCADRGFLNVGKAELLERLMKVDVYGPAFATRKAVRVFLEKECAGSIVNVASIAGICGGKSGCAYTMAKHAVIGLTKSTAFAYRLNNIRCNAICPGGINTEMTDPALFATADQKGLQSAMLSMHFGTRSAEAIEIADVALFLASDEAAVVNGAIVTADSGLTSF